MTIFRAPSMRANTALGRISALIVLGTLLWCARLGVGAEVSLSEPQLKALFLLNFAKYVYWPPDAFPTAGTPITIGLLGQDYLKEELKRVVEGKSVNSRAIVVKRVASEADLAGCHILFVSSPESSRLAEILNKTVALPVLTVADNDRPLPKRTIISFISVEKKIHLQIDLEAARQTRLQISSKLLGVADVVKGKSG